MVGEKRPAGRGSGGSGGSGSGGMMDYLLNMDNRKKQSAAWGTLVFLAYTSGINNGMP